MTDYESMSDFEINCAVAYHIGLSTVMSDESLDFKPCNSWADAGLIIENHKISIKPVSRVRNYNEHYDAWEASVNGPHFEEENKNPLRAAMIVFLMMKNKDGE